MRVYVGVPVCVRACVCRLAQSHTSQIHMAKKWHLEVDTHTYTASLLHNRPTHTHPHRANTSAQQHWKVGGGGRREWVGTATPTHLVQQNAGQQSTELSSAQAQAQANNNNNNNDISRARAECATPPTKWLAGSAWGSSFCCSLCQIRLGFALSCSWR